MPPALLVSCSNSAFSSLVSWCPNLTSSCSSTLLFVPNKVTGRPLSLSWTIWKLLCRAPASNLGNNYPTKSSLLPLSAGRSDSTRCQANFTERGRRRRRRRTGSRVKLWRANGTGSNWPQLCLLFSWKAARSHTEAATLYMLCLTLCCTTVYNVH